MASTIKLKTSTSSGNVPASLAKGEVAINVADGVWYYGGASSVQQNFTFGGITVTGNTSLDGKLVVTGNTVMNGTLSASSVNVGNGAGSVSAATITASGEIDGGSLDIEGDADINGTTNLDNTDIDGTFTMDGTAFDVNGTTTVAIDNTNTTNGVTINTVTSGGKVFIGHTTSETTVNDNLSVTGDLAVDGTSNLDNTDVDGTLVVDGSNISLDSTSTLNIDNSNTSNGITIGTATSGVPIQLGHSTSNVRINDNLVVTGNTVMNGTLSATTSLKVGNGNGTISAATINGVAVTGTFVGQVGTDAAPVRAYISSGDIDSVLLGSESAVAITESSIVTINNGSADQVALTVKGHAEQSASFLSVINSADESLFEIASNGRMVTAACSITGGAIDGTAIGNATRSTGKFSGLDANTTLVVTGKTTLNNTLSATTSCKVGNGDGLISGATIHAGNVLKSDGTLVVTGNTVLNGTLSATTSLKVGNGDGTISAATITSSGDMTSGGDVYTDVVRRQSDSSTTTKIKLDDESIKTFAGSSSLWSVKVSSQELLVGQSGAGLLSATTLDSLTQKVANGTAFSPRPNLYWFGNCDAATVGPASDGSFPATNTTDVSWGETHNSHAAVFSAASDQVQIVRAGLYKISYNVTLEGGADGTTSNRTGGGITLLRKAAGGTYAVVDGAESYVYCRIANIERNTGTVSVIYNVTANDVFKIVFIRTGSQTSASKLGTITAGTSWTIESVS